MEQHKADLISLAFGGLFVTLALLLPAGGWADWNLSQWVVPAAVLLLGVGIAVSAVASTRR
jgi:hypothetical protein